MLTWLLRLLRLNKQRLWGFLKAVKVTSAEWLKHIAEQIDNLVKKIDVHGIHGGTLFTHMAQTAQFGGDAAEVWVVFDSDKPVAFAHWNTLGIPHVGSVYMGFLHSWQKTGTATKMLIDEYLKYGERVRAEWYFFDPITQRHYNTLEHALKKRGKKLRSSKIIHSYCKR